MTPQSDTNVLPSNPKDVGCFGTILILASGAMLWWIVFGVFNVPLCKGHWLGKQYVCERGSEFGQWYHQMTAK